ncbi:hypothetical protein N7470_005200 [Penicillium chermesinum]|nr:hypothetical protein N7470_005200 [Penicillium chermesinum]
MPVTLLETTQDELFASTETTAALKSKFKVHIVPSHDSSHPRTVYDHARTEKEARGVAYARAKRVLTRDSIVILDGMNYIKGWRYQLWCEAKAANTTCCVVRSTLPIERVEGSMANQSHIQVHVGTPIDQCVANNNRRLNRQSTSQPEPQPQPLASDSAPSPDLNQPTPSYPDTEEPYPPELLDNLIFRYEEPSTHSRWDKPLFTVPWDDPAPPVADIFHALTGVAISPAEPNPAISSLTESLASSTLSSAASVTTARTGFTRAGGTGSNRPRIIPTKPPDPTALNTMEKRTTAVVNAIRAFTQATPSAEVALAQSDDPNGISIPVPDAETKVFVPAHVAATGTTDELAGAGGVLAAPKLQRLRRQWISLNRRYVGHGHGAMQGGLAADQIGDAFVRFLNSTFGNERD